MNGVTWSGDFDVVPPLATCDKTRPMDLESIYEKQKVSTGTTLFTYDDLAAIEHPLGVAMGHLPFHGQRARQGALVQHRELAPYRHLPYGHDWHDSCSQRAS